MKLSKSNIGGWVACSFLLAALAGAEEQCEETARWPDNEVCRHPLLRDLDQSLNNAYQQLRASTKEKSALRREQRQWLRSDRNTCSNSECLLRVYRDRVAELGERLVNAASLAEQPLNNAEARQACEAIAARAGAGSLGALVIPGHDLGADENPTVPPHWALTADELAALKKTWQTPLRLYRLRLSPGKPAERFVSIAESTSCPSLPLLNLRYLATPEDAAVSVHDPEELTRWALWNGEDLPLYLNNRLFLVSSNVSDVNAVSMVSWVTPEGRSRPLCMLSAQPSQLSVVRAKKPELCARIAAGRLSPLAWKDEGVWFDKTAGYGDKVDQLGVLELDLNADGHTEKIARLQYSSGAGCGATHFWLARLDNNAASNSRILLDEGYITRSDPLNIYPSQGKYYVAFQDTLVQFKDEKAEQVCEFKRLTPRKVSTLFDVTYRAR